MNHTIREDGTPFPGVEHAPMRDIEALRQAFEQRRLALEAAQLGAWDFRFDTGEVFWDERCRDMFGVSNGDQISYDRAIECIHPEDRADVDHAVSQALAGAGGGDYNKEFRVVWRDGSVHWVSSHGRVYFEGEGERRRPVRFIGVNMDTTERRQAEERLRQAQKLESIGFLAGGIAHDFNNLLTLVIGRASMLLDEVPAEFTDGMRDIISAAERAALLTRHLLAYSGRGAFEERKLNLSEAVHQFAESVHSLVPRGVELRTDLEERLPPISTDPGLLELVVENLVINAGESIGEGCPGVISVSTRLCNFDGPFTGAIGGELAAGQYVCLEVVDDGAGMDEPTKTRIFDPFFTTKFIGRGLGLSAVSGIMRSQRGSITVETAPGKGAAFRLFFPPAAI